MSLCLFCRRISRTLDDQQRQRSNTVAAAEVFLSRRQISLADTETTGTFDVVAPPSVSEDGVGEVVESAAVDEATVRMMGDSTSNQHSLPT